MADVVDKATRSRMMAGIRAKNTKPEILIRSALHRRGFRFRLNQASLPGKPDLVLRKYGAVIFIHGCFWHGHDCPQFKWPQTNADFWKKKIRRNRKNDSDAESRLETLGWRCAVVWECALKGSKSLEMVTNKLEKWLKASSPTLRIDGQNVPLNRSE